MYNRISLLHYIHGTGILRTIHVVGLLNMCLSSYRHGVRVARETVSTPPLFHFYFLVLVDVYSTCSAMTILHLFRILRKGSLLIPFGNLN